MASFKMKITTNQYNIIINHAKQDFPKEACGILSGKDNKVKEVYKCKNISDNPIDCYFMDSKEQLKIFKEIRCKNLELLAIYHSHTHTKAYPSKRDLELAFYPDSAYVIISLENLHRPVLKAFRINEDKMKEITLQVAR